MNITLFFLTHILSHLRENIGGNDWYEDSAFLSLSRHWRPWLQSSHQVVLIPSLRISQIHLATITSRAGTHRAPLAKTEPVPWAWPMTKRGEDAGPQAHRSERRGWAAPATYGPQAHQPVELFLSLPLGGVTQLTFVLHSFSQCPVQVQTTIQCNSLLQRLYHPIISPSGTCSFSSGLSRGDTGGSCNQLLSASAQKWHTLIPPQPIGKNKICGLEWVQ